MVGWLIDGNMAFGFMGSNNVSSIGMGFGGKFRSEASKSSDVGVWTKYDVQMGGLGKAWFS